MSDEVTGWLAERAVPLRGLVAGVPSDDLQPLKGVLSGVRVVGLGESTHGTREFFQLKHRLLEFLVTELGFSVLAMEASASAAPAVDAYVRHGVGDAATVLRGLGFWTWRTYEVLAVIEWMRAYNRGRPEEGKIRFAGIDPQKCGASVSVLETLLSERAADRVAGLRSLLGVLAEAHPGQHPDPRRRLVREAEDLAAFVRERFPEAQEAVRHARILVRAADLVTRDRLHDDPRQTVYAVRDRYMAEAVQELLAAPSTKVVLWAHNGHIAKSAHGDGPLPLGHHLKERYGDAYYALGLLFGKGSFRACRGRPKAGARARPPVGNRIGMADGTTVEARLAAAGRGDLVVDLRSAADAPDAVRQWLHEPSAMRSFGAHVPRWTYHLHRSPTVPAREYDGLAYVATSTNSRLLPPDGAP
ncbi:erythromycin esterase family protein [Streptomyces chrestomyceticus]|uniref:erythromycin esterase family protein n=1 Tax=Streptomyces chrestomyceticus TaxID=68185 RepID=UPI0019D02892|nr:erythromycin esterase family protein [Streptomyces chrestomyceticus]